MQPLTLSPAYLSLPYPLPFAPYPMSRTCISILLLTLWLPVPCNVPWCFWLKRNTTSSYGAWNIDIGMNHKWSKLNHLATLVASAALAAQLSMLLSAASYILLAAACDAIAAHLAANSLATLFVPSLIGPEAGFSWRKLLAFMGLALGLWHGARQLPLQHWARPLFIAAAAPAACDLAPQCVITRLHLLLPLLSHCAAAAARAISSLVTFLSLRLWPQLAAAAAFVWSYLLLLSPALSLLNRCIAAPLWHVMSPLVVPAILAGVSFVHATHAAAVRALPLCASVCLTVNVKHQSLQCNCCNPLSRRPPCGCCSPML